jgi:N-acetylglutamate synthase-like GNAT family acetyltransferase
MVRAARLNPVGLDWRRFAVAIDGTGEVIACVQVKPHGAARELASLVVARGWRGQGLGQQMVRHVQQEAGPPLWLMCRSTLVPFYERSGFREVRRHSGIPRYFRAMHLLFGVGRRLGPRAVYLTIMVWDD